MPDLPFESFEEIEHTADWALEVRGIDLPELFVNAARGMLDLSGVSTLEGPARERSIEMQAPDRESLLVDWLNELLFFIEMEQLAFEEIDLKIVDGPGLRAKIQTVPVASVQKPIKAVTFNDLQIQETPLGVQATLVFDV